MKNTELPFTKDTSGSAFVRLQEDMDIWLWYSSGFNRLIKYIGLEGATKEGLVPIPDEDPWTHWAIYMMTQSLMLQSYYYTTDEGKNICLISPSATTFALQYPVFLGSLLERPKEETLIERTEYLPPATHGTACAILDKESKWYYYYITELSTEAQERQKQISQKLEEMEARRLSVLLNGASTVDETSIPELAGIIRALAQDYYNYHIKQTELTQQKNQCYKSPQMKRDLPRAVNPFNNGIAPMSTCLAMQLFTYATQNAISGASRWRHPKDHRPYFPYNGDIIEYGDSNQIIADEEADALWKQVKQQGYTVIDMAAFAISLFARSQEPDHSAWVYASKFIESRGLAKMKKAVTDEIKRDAGHQQKNYKDVEQSVMHLEKIWVTISQDINEQEYNPKTKKRKQRKLTYKGRFIVVKGMLTQKDLGTTDSETSMEIAWHMAPGDWLAPFLEYPNRQIANLSDHVLRYNPRLQKWEKSLGYYFFFNGHMNSKGSGCTFNRYLEPLLKTCSLDEEIERGRPQRTRDRFEKAMKQLVEDRLINRWHYTEHKDGYTPTKRSWIDEWLGLKITVEIAPKRDLLS